MFFEGVCKCVVFINIVEIFIIIDGIRFIVDFGKVILFLLFFIFLSVIFVLVLWDGK